MADARAVPKLPDRRITPTVPRCLTTRLGHPMLAAEGPRMPDLDLTSQLTSQADHEPAAELGEQGEKLIKRMRATGRPVILTHEGRDSAVLIDIALYERLLDEIEVLRDVHRAQRDVDAGRVTAHEDARSRLLGRYP
jgi:prevent-host-death family protein